VVRRARVVVAVVVVAVLVVAATVGTEAGAVVDTAAGAASTAEAVRATTGSGETACQSAPNARAVAPTTPQRAGALLRGGARRGGRGAAGSTGYTESVVAALGILD
jgi:hypothetical protein